MRVWSVLSVSSAFGRHWWILFGSELDLYDGVQVVNGIVMSTINVLDPQPVPISNDCRVINL